MVVGSGRGNGSGTGAADAFVDAYRRGGEIKKGLKAIDLLWGELWMMVCRSEGHHGQIVFLCFFVLCPLWACEWCELAWADLIDGWAVRGLEVNSIGKRILFICKTFVTP
jgi:hypothetical protein